MDTKTILFINLSIVFVLLNVFEIVSSQDIPAPDPAVVQECAKKIGDHCGDRMLVYIFIQKMSVSEECCAQLINSGRDCHNALTESLLSTKRFTNKVPQLMEKHNEVWNLCEKDRQIA